jgi:hypothetical protein
LDEVIGRAQQTTDGGYIAAGCTDTYGAGDYDVYLVKTDANGLTLWSRTYGGPAGDLGLWIQQTADSGYIIAGVTESFGAGGVDVYLIKINSVGDTMWTRTYGGPRDDVGLAVQQTADDGYIVAGRTSSYGAESSDVYIVRTDANGDTLWTRTYGGTGYDIAASVQQAPDGGYIVAGSTQSFGAGNGDVWLIKTDASGDTMWNRTFGGTGNDAGKSVQLTADRGYIVAGATWSFGSGLSDVYLIKTDSLGRVGVEEPETPASRASALSLTCEPNPCRGRTAISFQLTANSSAQLSLFDASGRLVLSQPVRTSPFILHPSSLPAGVYVARLDCGAQHASTRIVLQR